MLQAEHKALESTVNDAVMELDNLQYAVLNCEAQLMSRSKFNELDTCDSFDMHTRNQFV